MNNEDQKCRAFKKKRSVDGFIGENSGCPGRRRHPSDTESRGRNPREKSCIHVAVSISGPCRSPHSFRSSCSSCAYEEESGGVCPKGGGGTGPNDSSHETLTSLRKPDAIPARGLHRPSTTPSDRSAPRSVRVRTAGSLLRNTTRATQTVCRRTCSVVDYGGMWRGVCGKCGRAAA